MHKFLSATPFGQKEVIAFLRIIIAIFLIIHGKEVLDPVKMKEYAAWDQFKNAPVLAYLGKGAELVAGILLLLGWFTRVSCLIIIGTFGYITFLVGHGKFWMEDQHPFMFVLFGILFLFTGPGALSLDAMVFRKKS